MGRRAAIVGAGAWLGVLTTIAGIARAEGPPRDPAAADVLFHDGRRLMAVGDFAHACPKFEESMRLDPAPGALLNLGDCEERLGHLARALSHYTALFESLPPSDQRSTIAAARIGRLAPRVPRLEVRLVGDAPKETVVSRDGILLGRASLGASLPVDPGEHTITVTSPARFDRQVTIRMREGERRTVLVAPGEPAPTPTTRSPSARRVSAWVLGGIGVASVAVGGYFGVRALSRRSDSNAACTNGVCADQAAVNAYDDAKSDARIADLGLGLGIVTLGLATYLFFTSPEVQASADQAPARAARARSPLTPSGLKLAW